MAVTVAAVVVAVSGQGGKVAATKVKMALAKAAAALLVVRTRACMSPVRVSGTGHGRRRHKPGNASGRPSMCPWRAPRPSSTARERPHLQPTCLVERTPCVTNDRSGLERGTTRSDGRHSRARAHRRAQPSRAAASRRDTSVCSSCMHEFPRGEPATQRPSPQECSSQPTLPCQFGGVREARGGSWGGSGGGGGGGQRSMHPHGG